jgi:putative flippase GtrA
MESNEYTVPKATGGALKKFVRFLVSGGIGAGVNIVFLYIFKELFSFWYLYASVLSFLVALIVSFLLQKFITFRDFSRHLLPRQTTVYALTALFNLGLNTGLMYVFVDICSMHYLLAQVVTMALIAIESYFIYQHYIFIESEVL